MKKLIIGAAVAMLGFAAQAVSVEWSTWAVYAAGADGTGWSSPLDVIGESDAYTTTINFYTDAGCSDLLLSDNAAGLDGDSYAGNVTSDSFAKGNTYYGILTVASNDGKYTLTTDAFQFSLDEGYASDIYSLGISEGGDGISLVSGKELNSDWGAFQDAGWQSVPEPTSGLLLLLGVAGLALKRKRA